MTNSALPANDFRCMQAPHAHLKETALTFSRPLGMNEFSYVWVRGSRGYADSFTVVSLSCTGGYSITDEEVVRACASLRLRHPLLASRVSFSSPQLPELYFTSPLTQGHALREACAQIEFHTFNDQDTAADALRDHWLAAEPDDVLDIRNATCSLWWAKDVKPDSGKYILGIRTTHFITDGRRRLNLVRCFLELLATPGRALEEVIAHFAGKTPLVEMPPALEHLMPDLKGVSAEEIGRAKAAFDELVKFRRKPLSGLVPDGPINEETLAPHLFRHIWTEDETTRILKGCKAHGVTITILVNVATALASVQRAADGDDKPVDDPYYFEFSQAIDFNSKVPRTSNNGEVETAIRILIYPIVISVPRSAAKRAEVKNAMWDAAREFKAHNDEFVKSPYFWHFIGFYHPMLAENYFANMAGKPFMPYMSSLGDIKNLLPIRYPITYPEVNGSGTNGGIPGAEIIIEDQTTAGIVDPQLASFLLYTFDGRLQVQFKWNAGRTSVALIDDWFKRMVAIISQAGEDGK